MNAFSRQMIGLLALHLILLALLAPLSIAMGEPGCFDCDAGPEFSPFTALLAVFGTAVIAFIVRKRTVQNTHN